MAGGVKDIPANVLARTLEHTMKTQLDCYPCILRQALEAARMAGAEERRQRAVLDLVLEMLLGVDPTRPPTIAGSAIHRLVREEAGDGDPYRPAKEESTRQALALYPRLQALVAASEDPLETALRLAIAGNIIDLSTGHHYDLWATVERVLAQPFALDDREAFRAALARAGWVLYLGDNAGETVFDRLLIENLGRPVTYVARGGAVLNDATLEDARAAGLDRVAQLVDSGADIAGTALELCSPTFRRLFLQADMIIAKGMGNYETLSEQGPRIFFLLQVKCAAVSRDLGVPVGSIVLRQGGKSQEGYQWIRTVS